MSLFSEFSRLQRDMYRMMNQFDHQFNHMAMLQGNDDFSTVFPSGINAASQQQRLTDQSYDHRDQHGKAASQQQHNDKLVPTSNNTANNANNNQQLSTTGYGRNDSDWLTPFGGMNTRSLMMTPAVDVIAKDDRYTVKADLPSGLPKENVRVDLDTVKGVLTLSGQHSEQHESKDEKAQWIRRERSSGSFTRSLRLPNDCDIKEGGKQLTAKFNNGVLELDIPRKKIVSDPKLKETTQQIKIE